MQLVRLRSHPHDRSTFALHCSKATFFTAVFIKKKAFKLSLCCTFRIKGTSTTAGSLWLTAFHVADLGAEQPVSRPPVRCSLEMLPPQNGLINLEISDKFEIVFLLKLGELFL